MILNMGWCWRYNSVNILNITKLYTFTWLKYQFSVMYMFPQLKKKKVSESLLWVREASGIYGIPLVWGSSAFWVSKISSCYCMQICIRKKQLQHWSNLKSAHLANMKVHSVAVWKCLSLVYSPVCPITFAISYLTIMTATLFIPTLLIIGCPT